MAMTPDQERRAERLQARIDAAVSGLRYSPYLEVYGAPVQQRFEEAARPGGLEGMERALDLFDHLVHTEDAAQVRYGLFLFLLHHAGLEKLGLRAPVRTPGPPPQDPR
jgi:hypothetical protein